MQRQGEHWDGAWRSATWANTRALWKRPTPEEEAHDARTWSEAACEHGSFASVLWCEIRQLVADLISTENVRFAATEAGHPPKSPEGR